MTNSERLKEMVDDTFYKLVAEALLCHDPRRCLEIREIQMKKVLSDALHTALGKQRENYLKTVKSHGVENGQGFYCPDDCVCKRIVAKIEKDEIL